MSLSVPLSLSLALFSLVSVASAQLPSASDVTSGYRLNASHFAKARITWRYSLKNTNSFYKADERNAQLLESRSEGPGVSSEAKAAMMRQAKEFRSSSAGTPKELVFVQDYWTDGLRKQVRIPASPLDVAAVRLWQVPDDPINPESLTIAYKDTSILSYNPKANERLRIWAGYQPDTKTNSSVRSTPLEEYYTNFMYPPLVVHEQTVKEQFLHPIDRFFALPVQDMQVKGYVELEGVKAFILEYNTTTQSSLQTSNAAKFEYLNTTTVFVDPSRGYLPIRIEYRSDRLVNGQRVEQKPSEPSRIVRCTSIKTVDGVAFYPIEGVEELYAADPSSPQYGTPQTPESFRAKGRLMPTALYHENTWSVDRLDLTPNMPDSMYALEFPDKTQFYNAILERQQMKGVPDKVFDQMMKHPDMPIRQEPATRSDNNSRILFITGNIVLLIVLVAMFCLRRIRKARGRQA